MLDFRPKKPSAVPRFSLDRAEQARMAGQRQHRSKRGWWHALFILIVVGTIIWVGFDWIKAGTAPEVGRVQQERGFTPMARPGLDGLPTMPAAAEIAAQHATLGEAVSSGMPPTWAGDNDAALLAWVQAMNARDLASPPLPQSVEAKDLLLRHVRIGSPVMVAGQLIDSAPAPLSDGAPGWQRQIVQLEPDAYALLLAPADAITLPVGGAMQCVGRFVGFLHLPCPKPATEPAPGAAPTPASVEVPFIIARRVDALGSLSGGPKPFWKSEGLFTVPADIYDHVDDERLVLETRPYYYLLGQLAQERGTPEVFAKAGDANRAANDLHQDPSKFRGQPFTVRGKVFNAWVDPLASRDQPFGVQRVVRIIFWSEDWSPLTMQVGGKTTVVNKLVTRVFEIAAISNEPPPAPGTRITATGRFLRLRAMEVKPNAHREEAAGFTRQSNRSYTFFFVSDGWKTLPPDEPAYTWTWWNWLLLAGVVLFAAWVSWMSWRSRATDSQVQESVRKLRAGRQRTAKPTAPPAGEAQADAGKPPPPAAP